jgi:hypothetical protein
LDLQIAVFSALLRCDDLRLGKQLVSMPPEACFESQRMKTLVQPAGRPNQPSVMTREPVTTRRLLHAFWVGVTTPVWGKRTAAVGRRFSPETYVISPEERREKSKLKTQLKLPSDTDRQRRKTNRKVTGESERGNGRDETKDRREGLAARGR